MNEISIIPFDFDSYAVRVVMRDGSPWFVAKDICDILHIILQIRGMRLPV